MRYRCSFCNKTFDAEDGGCNCTDRLQCQCGLGSWGRSYNGNHTDDPVCSKCGTGSIVEGKTHRSTHIARIEHGGSIHKILSGDKYMRAVTFCHYPGGAFTLKINKTRLEKGPNWAIVEVMES